MLLEKNGFKTVPVYFDKSITVKLTLQQYYHRPTINTEVFWFHLTINTVDN